MSDLEARIRRLEDRAELQDLVVSYFIATDDDDVDTVANCFTENARFSASGFVGGANRQDVMKFLGAARAGMGQTVHTFNYAKFNFISAKSAAGIIGAHLELSMGGTTVYGAVRYLDEYSKADGAWRIRARDMRAVHMGPWGDVATSLTAERNVRWPGEEPLATDFPRKSVAGEKGASTREH